MERKFKSKATIVVTVLLMMASGTVSINAQLLYKDSHLFIGPTNAYTDLNSVGPAINLIMGTEFGIEHNLGGLNFYILWPNLNWGDYKLFISESGKVGVGRAPTTYDLEVNGQVWTTAGLLITSDGTQKRNVKDMEEQRPDYVTKLKQLKGKSYEKLIKSGKDNAAEVERMIEAGKLPREKAQEALQDLNTWRKDTYKSEYGFIAQDVKELFPELVEENAEGILAVNYTGLIPVLLEAIKDLQNRVEKLEKSQGNNGGISVRSVSSPVDAAIAEGDGSEYLSQNAPNPIDGSTVIRYNLPEGATQAAIAIYSTGSRSIVKIFPLDTKARSGSITVSASDLAKGIYVYNLTANGIVLGSKRMINP